MQRNCPKIPIFAEYCKNARASRMQSQSRLSYAEAKPSVDEINEAYPLQEGDHKDTPLRAEEPPRAGVSTVETTLVVARTW